MVHVLIVEDDADIRDFLCEVVRDYSEGHHLDVQVDAAANGAEGLERLKRLRYDLILTDLRMPLLSGVQMIHRMGEEGSRSKDSPIVLVTGNRMDPELGEIPELEILEKPLVLAPLYFILGKYLSAPLSKS